jgi:hypothetical protein
MSPFSPRMVQPSPRRAQWAAQAAAADPLMSHVARVRPASRESPADPRPADEGGVPATPGSCHAGWAAAAAVARVLLGSAANLAAGITATAAHEPMVAYYHHPPCDCARPPRHRPVAWQRAAAAPWPTAARVATAEQVAAPRHRPWPPPLCGATAAVRARAPPSWQPCREGCPAQQIPVR